MDLVISHSGLEDAQLKVSNVNTYFSCTFLYFFHVTERVTSELKEKKSCATHCGFACKLELYFIVVSFLCVVVFFFS